MTLCKHKKLILLEKKAKKIRCRHCHLTIDEKELAGGHCPECQEVYGVRRRDFEEVKIKNQGAVVYRCEDCGTLITIE
jgi:Zn finger protein HypA/HybF involved in hydrogenase expression